MIDSLSPYFFACSGLNINIVPHFFHVHEKPKSLYYTFAVQPREFAQLLLCGKLANSSCIMNFTIALNGESHCVPRYLVINDEVHNLFSGICFCGNHFLIASHYDPQWSNTSSMAFVIAYQFIPNSASCSLSKNLNTSLACSTVMDLSIPDSA